MLAVLDIRTPYPAQKKLESLGIEVILLPPFSLLAEQVASHPDMLLFPFGDKIICHSKYYNEARSEIDKIAKDKELILSDEYVSPVYPHDVLFNAAVLGDRYLICNKKRVSSKILDAASEYDLSVIHVNQGYSKCSSCIVSDNALITSDKTIFDSAKKLGADTLFVENKNISLPGYDCGFIGGCSGLCEYTNEIFFCGDVGSHPNGDEIISFCKNHGKTPVMLTQERLFDIGSIFFI
ncbi:MAG: hypothetical protein II365_00935 [Clostridia bacterium]|nr:hypothetical protein [Clostridia bacterium]